MIRVLALLLVLLFQGAHAGSDITVCAQRISQAPTSNFIDIRIGPSGEMYAALRRGEIRRLNGTNWVFSLFLYLN